MFAGFQEMERAREGLAILLNDVWYSAVLKSGFVYYRILWIKFKFSRVKICVVVRFDPSEDVEERDIFWNDMDRILDREGNGYRLCILGDLNRWIGDRTSAGMTGAFRVPGENDNGRRVVKFCAERGLWVGKIYFKHRSLRKYTRVQGVKMEWR